MTHKGIHDRGYLPHWDFAGSVQAITFRLADSLPNKVVNEWRKELANQLNSPDEKTSRMCDYHDRFIRDLDHFHNARAYIRQNPVKAKLCGKPEEWPYSSAGQNWSAEFIPPETTETPEAAE